MLRNWKTLTVIAALLILCPAASNASDNTQVGLFTPDLVAAEYADAVDEFEVYSNDPMSLPVLRPYNANMVNTEKVDATGAGVYVAVLDSGMLPQWESIFSEANVAWDLGKGFTHDVYWDDEIGGALIGPLRDDRGFWTEYGCGHGTHVASTVVGFNILDTVWIDGIAPDATIIPVLVLDAWKVETGDPEAPFAYYYGGTDEMVAAGIYYIGDLADELDGPVVINMSLGGPGRSPVIEAAIDYAISKGVIIVVSAGNSGTEGMGYPGGLRQVISTGAMGWASMFLHGWLGVVPDRPNQNDELGNNHQYYLENFSSRPNKDLDQKTQDLDVSAPGAWIVGPWRPEFHVERGYHPDFYDFYYLSGTSMSAPHVSAIAALVLEENPGLQQADVEFILRNASSGNTLPANDSTVYFPFGYIDSPFFPFPDPDAPYYTASWKGGDFGMGFVTADRVLRRAALY